MVKESLSTSTKHIPDRAIVVDGNPTASILLQKEYSKREEQAAKELQNFIKKSTGVSIPIVTQLKGANKHIIKISVMEKIEAESSDAFSILVRANRTEIKGKSPLATLYGVYDLLEEGLGVRWYLPGPLGEVVPKNETLIFPPLNYQGSPSFPMRWVGVISPSVSSELKKADKWMLRNKQNGSKDGFNIFPDIYHTQDYWLPREKYFEEHPEYFALVDGKRSNDKHAKLCYSNPEVAKEIAENMSAILDTKPEIDLLSFSPTDGQLWCECNSCRAMDEEGVPSDQSKSRRSLIFYNRIASELKKSHPDAELLVGAYNVYTLPPKDTTINADEMLNVIICHYSQYCLAHSVFDDSCPPNQRYLNLVKDWESLVGNNIFFYEYYWKVNWLDLPWPIVHTIRKDIPWYYKQGYKGLYTQYNAENTWTLYPNYYIASRLLWDQDANVDYLLKNMYENLFGEAAPWIEKYYSLMEEWMAKCGEHFAGAGSWGDEFVYHPVMFTIEIRKMLREYYEKAVKANNDPTVSHRLERIGTSLEYIERLMHFVDLRKQAKNESNPKKAYAIANQALAVGKELLDEIRRDRTKWGGVVSMSVISPGYYLDRYVKQWEEYVDELKSKF
jgi:hypothetical protein